MPKINNYFTRVESGDIEQSFNITIYYNNEDKFYAEIPEGFWESCEILSKKESDKLRIRKKNKYKYSSGPYKFIVWSEKEDDAVAKMKIVLELMIKKTIKKEPVIVIEFDNEGTFKSLHERWPGDPDLPKVGLAMRATYCHQLKSGAGEMKYFKYWKSKKIIDDGYETLRCEISVDNNSTIIPDTPENRKFLEDLHMALTILADKLMQFAGSGSSKKLLETIASTQKLLELNHVKGTE